MSASVNIGGSSADKKVRVNAIDPPKELFITGTGVTVTDNPTLGRYDIAITGGSTNPLAKGTAVKSGDSTTKVFTFAHGMTNPPVFAVVVPESTDALGSYTTTWDSTNITITYPFAPPTATNNLSYAWFAMDINGGGGQAVSGGGGGSGEANTSSNAGIDGIGIVLPKSNFNLPFKALNVGSSRLSITDDTTDHTVDFDVNEGSLNIGNMTGIIGNSRISDLAYSKLTSVPSTIVQTNQSNTFGNFAQAFFTQTLDIYNAARSAVYIFSASAIAGNRVVTLPLLTGNDQFTFDNFATTLTNKTMDAGSNTFTNLNNAAISLTAAIAYSKLNLTSSIVNADISGTAAIAYSKLNLAGSIVNTDISTSAAIPYSKLNLASSIVNADLSAAAAIAYSKIGTNLLFSESGLTALRTITFPDSSGVVVYSTDSRLTNARTPIAHATTHESGGSDSIPLDTLAPTTDITSLNSSITAHGLLPKLSNVSTQYLNGTGAWTTPPTALTEAKGTSTQSGDASSTAFTISHGLAGTPTYVSVVPSSVDADDSFFVTVNATTITITYAFAPPNTAGNLSWWWRVAL